MNNITVRQAAKAGAHKPLEASLGRTSYRPVSLHIAAPRGKQTTLGHQKEMKGKSAVWPSE